MTRSAPYVALWALLLAALVVTQFAFAPDTIQWALPFCVVAALLVLAGLLFARPSRERVRLLPDTSYATVLLAVGVVMIALGLVFGMWLYLMGAGVVVLGAGGIARELLAARRSAS